MEKLSYYRHNAKEKQMEMLFNTIEYYELTVVLEGELDYTINESYTPVKAGDIIFVKKGSSRRRKPCEATNYISLNFYSDENYDFPLVLENGASEIVRSLLFSMDAIFKFTHNLDDERFSLLLQCLLKQLEAERKVEREHPLVVKIKKFVKTHIEEKITLDEICAQVFFSPAYCESIFKKETGITIIDYALNEKLAMAQMLLREGTLPLIKIAELVGFFDYNYFCRLFKKRIGISPLNYKKQYAKIHSP